MHKKYLPCLFISLFVFASSHAEPVFNFIGQFGDRAVIHVNGKQRLLRVGETSKEGIKLLSVGPSSALIDFNGEQRTLNYSPGNDSAIESGGSTGVTIWADRTGSFQVPGTINGQLVNCLIDTGATQVAMNEVTANRLGIDFRYSGEPAMVTTASGMVAAYSVTLKSVRIGEIELNHVEALVLEGGFPLQVLLGMSFLSHLELERKGNMIMLRDTR